MRDRIPTLAAAIALCLVAALVAAPGSLAEDPKPESKKEDKQAKSDAATKREKEAEAEEKKVFTNEDLERMFGPSEPPKASEESEPGTTVKSTGDALRRMQDEAGQKKTRDLRALEVEREVSEAEAEIRRLEDRVLKIRNPLLPRPELSPEEQKEWQGLSNVERLERTERQLEEARTRRDAAQKKLRELRSTG